MKCCSDFHLAYSGSKNDHFHRVTEARVTHSCHLKNNQSFSVYAVKRPPESPSTADSHCSFSSLYSVCPLSLHQNFIFIQDYKSIHPFSTSYLYLRDSRLIRDDQISVCPATSSRFSGETPRTSQTNQKTQSHQHVPVSPLHFWVQALSSSSYLWDPSEGAGDTLVANSHNLLATTCSWRRGQECRSTSKS